MITYDCSHIDTCTPDYLTDHHNRDGELLLQAIVSRDATNAEVMAELIDDLQKLEYHAGADYHAAEVAIRLEFTGKAMDKPFDATPEPFADDDDSGEMCYAWFVLSWSDDDEGGEG